MSFVTVPVWMVWALDFSISFSLSWKRHSATPHPEICYAVRQCLHAIIISPASLNLLSVGLNSIFLCISASSMISKSQTLPSITSQRFHLALCISQKDILRLFPLMVFELIHLAEWEKKHDNEWNLRACNVFARPSPGKSVTVSNLLLNSQWRFRSLSCNSETVSAPLPKCQRYSYHTPISEVWEPVLRIQAPFYHFRACIASPSPLFCNISACI